MTTESDPPGYELLRRIGLGGSSVVWEATQLSTGRRVALKMLEVDVTDPAALRRFERERKVMSSLATHPGIVTIYDAGVHRHKPWLAMEYCRRGSLAEYVAEHGPLDPATALAVLQRCASALGAAHARDIVHCDVKPQNIMLTDHGEPAIGDFGIARVAVDRASTTTIGGGFTLDHAAPELLDGGRAGPASDVYSLGTTIWELLAGRPPFREHPDIAMAAVMMRIITQPMPDPPAGTPAELAELLRAMTAKRPPDRPADMARVAASAATIRAALAPVDPLGTAPFPAAPDEPDPDAVLERADTVRVTPSKGGTRHGPPSWPDLDSTVRVHHSPPRAHGPVAPGDETRERPVAAPFSPPPHDAPTVPPRTRRRAPLIAALITDGHVDVWSYAPGPGLEAAITCNSGELSNRVGFLQFDSDADMTHFITTIKNTIAANKFGRCEAGLGQSNPWTNGGQTKGDLACVRTGTPLVTKVWWSTYGTGVVASAQDTDAAKAWNWFLGNSLIVE